MDFLTKRVDDILVFLENGTDGLVVPLGRELRRPDLHVQHRRPRPLPEGEKAWGRLDSETAFYEFRTALENDASFALTHLRLVDVLIFRSDIAAARDHLERALAEKDRLSELDLLRLYALQARLDAKPGDERQFLNKFD